MELTSFLPEIMLNMSFDELLYIIPNYYQFCYAVTIEENFLVAQKNILENLLNPFSKILLAKLNKLKIDTLKYNLNDVFFGITTKVCARKVIYSLSDY